jgi:hypothetical protein
VAEKENAVPEFVTARENVPGVLSKPAAWNRPVPVRTRAFERWNWSTTVSISKLAPPAEVCHEAIGVVE